MEKPRKPLSPEQFERMVENSRWVQIMPAVGWMIEWKQDNLPEGKFSERVLCLGLTKAGDVEFLTADSSGIVDAASPFTNNLIRVYFNLAEYNKADA